MSLILTERIEMSRRSNNHISGFAFSKFPRWLKEFVKSKGGMIGFIIFLQGAITYFEWFLLNSILEVKYQEKIVQLKLEQIAREGQFGSEIHALREKLLRPTSVDKDSILNTIVVDKKVNEKLISELKNQIVITPRDQPTSRKLLESEISRLTNENVKLNRTITEMSNLTTRDTDSQIVSIKVPAGSRSPSRNDDDAQPDPDSDAEKITSGSLTPPAKLIAGYVVVERPQNQGGPFYMSKDRVTYKEFSAFVSATNRMDRYYVPNASEKESEKPVLRISWDEAKDFCDWKSKKDERNYRLPMVAEWEFAAKNNAEFRAGLSPKIWEWCNDALDLENKKALIIKIRNTGSSTIDTEEAYRNVRIGDLSFRIVIDSLNGMATK